MEGVICISLNRESDLSGKSFTDIQDVSKEEFGENLQAKPSALTAEGDNSSNRLKTA